MTIASLADVRSGLQPSFMYARSFVSNAANGGGLCKTSWPGTSGFPNPGGSYSGGLPGVALTAPITPGGMSLTNPPSGNNYIARMSLCVNAAGATSVSCLMMLCDRLWHNSGVDPTSTSPQTIGSPAWPARDENGSSNGQGVFLALEYTTGPTAVGGIVTVTYTNSDGVSGQVGTNTVAFGVHGATHTVLIGLQAGDRGVQSVQSIQFSSAFTGGVCALVAYRPLICVPTNGSINPVVDAITGCMTQIPNSAVLFFYELTGSSNADGSLGIVTGKIDTTWG